MNRLLRAVRRWFAGKREDFRAWRRGERRIAPGRGRVYAKKDGSQSEPEPAERKPVATITAKVTRADGTVEFHKASNVRVEHGNSSHDSRP